MPSQWYLKSTYPVSFPSDPLLFVTDEVFKTAIVTDSTITRDKPPTETPVTGDPSTPLNMWKRQNPYDPEVVELWDLCKSLPQQAIPSFAAVAGVDTCLSRLFGRQRQNGYWWSWLLPNAWYEDAQRTLAVLMYARSQHFGSGSRIAFYQACGQMYLTHPKTFLQFIKLIGQPLVRWMPPGDITGASEPTERKDGRLPVTEGVPFGCWKDALNLLMLAVNKTFNSEALAQRKVLTPRTLRTEPPNPEPLDGDDIFTWLQDDEGLGTSERDLRLALDTHIVVDDEDYASDDGKMPRLSKKEMQAFRHERAVEMFEKNPVYRAFHLTVARMFAGQLKEDLTTLEEAEKNGEEPVISHCAKWAPSHGRSHDRSTFIVSSIAEAMFPEELFTKELKEAGLTTRNEERRTRYLWLARMKYAGVLTRLRKFSGNLPEKLAVQEDQNVDYSTVSPKTMCSLQNRFLQHDRDRFVAWLDALKNGTDSMSFENISPGKLLPHTFDEVALDIARVRWDLLVKETRAKRKDELAMLVCIRHAYGEENADLDDTSMRTARNTANPMATMTFMLDCMNDSWNRQIVRTGRDLEWVDSPQHESLEQRCHQLFKRLGGLKLDFVRLYEELLLPRLLTTKAAGQPIPDKVIVISAWHFLFVETPTRSLHDPSVLNLTWSESYDRLKALFAENGLEIPLMIYWYCGKEGAESHWPPMGNIEGVKFLFDGTLDCTRAFIEGADIESLARTEPVPKKPMWVGKDGETMNSFKIMEIGLKNEAFDLFEVWD